MQSHPTIGEHWAVCFAWWQIWTCTAVAAAAWYWRDEPRRPPPSHRLLAATAILRLCRPPTSRRPGPYSSSLLACPPDPMPVLFYVNSHGPVTCYVPHTDVGHVMHCYLMMYIILSVEIASNVSSRLVSTAFKVWILCWWLLSTYYAGGYLLIHYKVLIYHRHTF